MASIRDQALSVSSPTSSPPTDLLWPHAQDHPLLAALGVSTAVRASWDTAIHPGDEMFEFSLGEADGDWNRAFFKNMRAGLLAYAAMSQVLDACEAAHGPARSVLDFASGYGLTTRFLLPRLGRERLWVADIQPGAVEFQGVRFGVNAVLSTSEPESFALTERFDVIFVLSLFSHLPPRAFRRWLAQLGSLLTERGVLVFSTLGEGVAPPGCPLGKDGWTYSDHSESASVVSREYGPLWARPDFVAAAIAEACGPEAIWQHFRRSLWHLQDVYVVTRSRASALSALRLRAGPVGFLEHVGAPAAHVLELRGWAFDPDGVEEPRVRIEVAGRPPTRRDRRSPSGGRRRLARAPRRALRLVGPLRPLGGADARRDDYGDRCRRRTRVLHVLRHDRRIAASARSPAGRGRVAPRDPRPPRRPRRSLLRTDGARRARAAHRLDGAEPLLEAAQPLVPTQGPRLSGARD